MAGAEPAVLLDEATRGSCARDGLKTANDTYLRCYKKFKTHVNNTVELSSTNDKYITTDNVNHFFLNAVQHMNVSAATANRYVNALDYLVSGCLLCQGGWKGHCKMRPGPL